MGWELFDLLLTLWRLREEKAQPPSVWSRDMSFMAHAHRWAGSVFLCLPPMADVDWVAEAGWLLSQVPRPNQEGCPSDPKL